jgi:hypothetical protein
VIEFFGGGHLEGRDLAPLRVHTGEHVLDDAVLARGIHGLENKEHAPSVVSVEGFL